MRARLLRPALGLAFASTAVLALGATAATKPLVIEDIAGDANALNDQFFGEVDNNPTPIQYASADIVEATLANTFKGRTCTGFTYTMEFSGEVDGAASLIYRLLGATTKNDNIFQIYFNNGALGGGTTEVRYGAGEEDETFELKTPAKIDGKKLVFTITTKEMRAFGEKPGGKIFDLVPEVRVSSGVSFFPVIDRAIAPEDASFTMCR